MASIKEVLLDAKKACGAAVVGAATALGAGLIGESVAAEITGVATVVITIVVYVLDNIPKPKPPAV